MLATDEQGRPTEVSFDGDPASQCPACLGEDVEPFPAIGMVWVGDRGDNMAPVRRMRCRACGANWMRPGL